jgi:hypothetical protein
MGSQDAEAEELIMEGEWIVLMRMWRSMRRLSVLQYGSSEQYLHLRDV